MASSNGKFAANVPQSSWNRFWFLPNDPTTLGFMRIITGLVVIYVHLSYCFDFQEFFGTHGWWDLNAANAERKDFPIVVYDWSRENQQKPTLNTPAIYDQRVAVFDFLKHLPQDKAQRDEVLQFLYYILPRDSHEQLSDGSYHQALSMLREAAPVLSDDRAKVVSELRKDAYVASALPLSLPDFFLQMPAAERVKTWNDAMRLLEYFPKPRANFIYVLGWLDQITPADRRVLATFLHELPGGQEGQQRLEYLETWRQDLRNIYGKGRYVFSLWFHLTDPTAMWVFHLAFLGIFVLFTIGLWTRVTSVLSWLAILCYIHRTQQVLFGMDSMMNILMFYLMIGPSGAALSVDRLIARYRASRAIMNAGGQRVPWAELELAGPRPSSLANFAIRLVQIHFCFIYAASGLAKLKGTTWWNSNAAWYTMANPEFCPVQFPFYEQMLHELATYRIVLAVVLMLMVYFTLALEISLPFLIWTRLRPYLVIAAIFLHSGIAWMMGLSCFGLLMMTLLLSYVPAATIRERLAWEQGSGPKMTLRFSSRNKRHAGVVSLLRALDFTGQISLIDLGTKNEAEYSAVQLIGADGETHAGYDALNYGLRNLVFGRTIAWLWWVPGAAVLLRLAVGAQHEAEHVSTPPAKTDTSAKTPLAR